MSANLTQASGIPLDQHELEHSNASSTSDEHQLAENMTSKDMRSSYHAPTAVSEGYLSGRFASADFQQNASSNATAEALAGLTEMNDLDSSRQQQKDQSQELGHVDNNHLQPQRWSGAPDSANAQPDLTAHPARSESLHAPKAVRSFKLEGRLKHELNNSDFTADAPHAGAAHISQTQTFNSLGQPQRIPRKPVSSTASGIGVGTSVSNQSSAKSIETEESSSDVQSTPQDGEPASTTATVVKHRSRDSQRMDFLEMCRTSPQKLTKKDGKRRQPLISRAAAKFRQLWSPSSGRSKFGSNGVRSNSTPAFTMIERPQNASNASIPSALNAPEDNRGILKSTQSALIEAAAPEQSSGSLNAELPPRDNANEISIQAADTAHATSDAYHQPGGATRFTGRQNRRSAAPVVIPDTPTHRPPRMIRSPRVADFTRELVKDIRSPDALRSGISNKKRLAMAFPSHSDMADPNSDPFPTPRHRPIGVQPNNQPAASSQAGIAPRDDWSNPNEANSMKTGEIASSMNVPVDSSKPDGAHDQIAEEQRRNAAQEHRRNIAAVRRQRVQELTKDLYDALERTERAASYASDIRIQAVRSEAVYHECVFEQRRLVEELQAMGV